MPGKRLRLPGRQPTQLAGLLLLAVVTVTVGCSRTETADQPSVLLVVLDTVRADAVSAYGSAPPGTTPTVDAIARAGLRYTNAFAPAPWTLPSHVSLFSGLAPEKHGVGLSQRVTADPGLELLAERLAGAGYLTAAFVENGMLGPEFNVLQGFAHFAVQTPQQYVRELLEPGSSGFNLERSIGTWLATRDRSRPFFLFVNILDAHLPYGSRQHPQWALFGRLDRALCDAMPDAQELPAIRQAYLGDVQAADAKLAAVARLVEPAAGGRNLITIVTSDHGEMLGENRLFDHQFTVHNAALQVPLVVRGVPGQPRGIVDTPVTLMDVTASALAWTGVSGGVEIDGVPLPLGARESRPPRDLLSAYADRRPDDWPKSFGPLPDHSRKRSRCGPADRVFGDMAALLRFPLKLVWYERYPSALYDLSVDPGERTDLSSARAEVAKEMRTALLERIKGSKLFAAGRGSPLDAAAEERMRALGYTD